MPLKSNYSNQLFNDYQKLELKNKELNDENRYLKLEYSLLKQDYQSLEKKYNALKEKTIEEENKKYQKQLEEKDKTISEKDKEIARLKSLLNNDGTNSGISTSKTPINKNKVIPNSRKKSGKNIGGQKGHKKHKLERFKDEEITEVEYIEMDRCPNCNHELIDTNETIDKDVLDYELVVVKKRIKFKEYKCPCCGKKVHSKIPNELKEDVQYGPNVKSLILSLLNEGYISINRVKRIIKGLSQGNIDLSESYIAKVQKVMAEKLDNFKQEVTKKLLKRKLLYWDDTVIFVDKKRACLRFYGDEKIALYVSHKQKNKDGLDEDNILKNLSNHTKVMHDHNKVNYNEEYSFINLECNAHLQRDLQKVIDNLKADWVTRLKTLISESIKQRNKFIENNYTYNDEFSNNFFDKFNKIMLSAIDENRNRESVFYKDEEKTLIQRILNYKDNYFAWIADFTLPTTNNLSERSLRSSKTKQKVSGQFKNIDRAMDYANIKTYIETSYRNGINPMYALFRLSIGAPFTLDEILNNEKLSEEK